MSYFLDQEMAFIGRKQKMAGQMDLVNKSEIMVTFKLEDGVKANL